MTPSWHARIESDPQILRGKPCIRGTRIPVALILGYLAAEKTADAIVGEFPDLSPADLQACLEYARETWLISSWRERREVFRESMRAA